MSLSACLVCKQARRASAGLVECRNNGETHDTMHVCLSFLPLWISERSSVSGPGSYVIPGQTATGCSK